MQSKKSLLQTGIIIGVCLGAVAGFLFPVGLLQYWRRLDYFPYPVAKIDYISVFGQEIWVETTTGDIFTVYYPCNEKICWKKSDALPDHSDRSGFGPYFELKVNQTCRFDHFTYPFFREVKLCVGTNYPVADTTEWIYLALTENGEIWAWQGGFIIPPACFFFPFAFAFVGVFPGLALGSVLIGIQKLKSHYWK